MLLSARSRPRSAYRVACAVIIALAVGLTGCGQGEATPSDSAPVKPLPSDSPDLKSQGQDGTSAPQEAATPFVQVDSVELELGAALAQDLVGATTVTPLTGEQFLVTYGRTGDFSWVDGSGDLHPVTGSGVAAIAALMVPADSLETDPLEPDPLEPGPADQEPDGQSPPNSVPEAAPVSEPVAGVFGVALSPSFAVDHLVYVFVSTGTTSSVVTVTFEDGQMLAGDVILEGLPAGGGRNGGALGFGPDNYLYVSVGDGGQPQLAQDLESLGGKILRVFSDGTVPSNNPLPESAIWSLGHRSVTALTWTDRGDLYAVEPGQESADELNLVVAGANYGWPHQEGTTEQGRVPDPAGFSAPALTWQFSAQGLTLGDPVALTATPEGLYIAGFHGQRIWRVGLEEHGLGQPQEFLTLGNSPIAGIVRLDERTLGVLTGFTAHIPSGGSVQFPLEPAEPSQEPDEPGQEPDGGATDGQTEPDFENLPSQPPVPTSDRFMAVKVTY